MNNCKQEIEMTLTQHAHSQHKGVHGVGQTSSSPPRPWRKHHFFRLGLLTFYLWMKHKRCCLSGLATNKTIYCIKELQLLQMSKPQDVRTTLFIFGLCQLADIN